ncbi:uncharacterized protein FSUBG_4593 [Fusarium subglutinans]|uniref:Uncharacterized protein n=1 Tax=Gibberella subglutinans TaxID=42677 RepID=A0A8H5V4C8_GIBSU|nr:uncharacterized protein FSUBG_4593 [Fusarium subglutinans]KAF5608375.1 hypothetical protein FSUBG_4593 [Fusarium subglutinans]
MSISETYGIRVSSGLHEVNGMHLARSLDKNLVLAPTDVAGLTFCQQCKTNETNFVLKDDSMSEFLSVIGPSGRGPYELRTSPETKPFGIGSMVYLDFSIKTLDQGTGVHTLGIADEDINDGHWMAWRDPEGNGEWSVYWVTPRPYNMDDLPGGMHIELTLDNKA